MCVFDPILYNIYINDLFYEFINTNVCNIADDTTPYGCDTNLPNLLNSLENNTMSAIMWFEDNTPEHLWAKVGGEVIWESSHTKWLGLVIDKNLNFNKHLEILCKKVSAKVSALARIIPLEKKRLLMRAFIKSQFS